jgi:CBS domain containing-hemolysin-like protein
MKLIILTVFIVLSAFFSGSESAFISANLTRLEVLIRRKVRGAKFTHRFLTRPENFLITILAGNNFTNVAYSIYFALFLHGILPTSVIVLLSTFSLLLFGEIIPKSIFRETANRWIIILTFLMQPVRLLLLPITFLFEKSTHFLMKLMHAENREETELFSKKELILHFRQSSRQGVIENEKGELIDNILNLTESKIKDLMIPRIDIVSLERNTPISEARALFEKTGLSRILVYDSEPEQIVGQIHVKDFFILPENISQIMREVIIVPESKTPYSMLLDFKRTKTSIAAAINEHGELAGLISIEDIIEALFGDIEDEHDDALLLFKKLNEEEYWVNARLEISYANEELGLNLPEGEYDTLAGLMITQMGKIPAKGESIVVGRWLMTVLEATKKKINVLKLKHLPETGD